MVTKYVVQCGLQRVQSRPVLSLPYRLASRHTDGYPSFLPVWYDVWFTENGYGFHSRSFSNTYLWSKGLLVYKDGIPSECVANPSPFALGCCTHFQNYCYRD